MNIERTASGAIEVCLSRSSGEFSRLCELVKNRLGGEWSRQLDHQDQSYWDLACCGTTITVHREHYLGVFLCCGDNPTNRRLLEQLICDLDATTAQGPA